MYVYAYYVLNALCYQVLKRLSAEGGGDKEKVTRLRDSSTIKCMYVCMYV